MKKKHLLSEAQILYTKELFTFSEISAKLDISERTLRLWALKNNWEELRDLFLEKTRSLLADRLEIVQMLGVRIKEDLKAGKEPAAATLNAYRGLSDNIHRIKEFEESEKPEQSRGLSELTAKAIKDVFGNAKS